MKRWGKKARRLARRRALPRIAGAAAAVAPFFGNTPSADADVIEYVASSTILTADGVNNTFVGDSITYRVTIETDNLVDDGSPLYPWYTAPVETFEFSVDGSATEIWQGTGGYLRYRDHGRFVISLGGSEPPDFDTVGEFVPIYAGLDHYPMTEGSFTSLHPSGAPLTFDLSGPESRQFFYFTNDNNTRDNFVGSYLDSIVGTVISETPDPDPDPEPDPCLVGDANCDGVVDIAGDILFGFSHFTGPGSFGKTRAQGDVEGSSGATTDPDGHDGDVDVQDVLTMFQAFSGSPDEAGGSGLVAAAAGDPAIPDLIYDPATGEVVLDVDGSSIIGYTLQNTTDSFLNANHTPLLGGVSTSLSSELAEAALSSPAGQNSIGFVFPTGLDLPGLTSLLSTNTVSRSLGSPLVPFDLVVLGPAVPEPSAAVLAATAGLAGLMALRKKRSQ